MKNMLAVALTFGGLVVAALAFLLSAPRPAGPPRLIVVIVVDQLRYDYLTRFVDLYEGGFRTLLDRGAVFTNARFRHGWLVTAPGHATVATGQHPSHHGVVGNSWYDPIQRKKVGAAEDPKERSIGGPGAAVSPRALLADTLGDRLKRSRWPESKVIGISLKDRSAMLLAGREADAAYWYSDRCGCFVTSSYYMEEPPGWLTEFNGRTPADQYYGELWERLLDKPALYERYARADAFPGEQHGTGIEFPHKLRGQPPDPQFYSDFATSGFADELLLRASLEAMRGHHLGEDGAPDILNVSFSGTDRVGHAYGPFSQEAMDQHLRLDRLLERLLKVVDEQVGLDRSLVALTSDHGAIPVVEHLQALGLPAMRVPAAALPDAVNAAVAGQYSGVGDVVAFFDAPHIFLDLALLEESKVPRAAAEELGRRALLATGFVEEVYTHTDLLGNVPEGDVFRRLYQNSFHEPRSPHLTVRLKEHHYVDGSQGATGHNTPYDYDRHVPVMFLGAGIKAGRYDKPAGPEDIAPTIAKMLGVTMPLERDGRLLREVLP